MMQLFFVLIELMCLIYVSYILVHKKVLQYETDGHYNPHFFFIGSGSSN